MNFNKEQGPKREPQKNKFEETLRKLNELIDLLSDADFRSKFPEFVNKYQMTIEQAEKIRSLNLTEPDTELSFKEQLKSLLEEAQDIRQGIPPDDRDKIDYVIKILNQTLND